MKIVLLVLGSILFAIGVGATVFTVFVAGAMGSAHGPGLGDVMGRLNIFLGASILVAMDGAGLFGLAFKYQ
jgi:hypothetical protein